MTGDLTEGCKLYDWTLVQVTPSGARAWVPFVQVQVSDIIDRFTYSRFGCLCIVGWVYPLCPDTRLQAGARGVGRASLALSVVLDFREFRVCAVWCVCV